MAIREAAGDPGEAAEAIGLAALVFLTEEEDRLGRCLSETGLSPDDLRAAAGTRHGYVAVLDHVLADESLLLVFTASAGIDPAAVGPARDVLAGDGDARQFASANYTSGNTTGRTGPKRASKRWPGPGE